MLKLKHVKKSHCKEWRFNFWWAPGESNPAPTDYEVGILPALLPETKSPMDACNGLRARPARAWQRKRWIRSRRVVELTPCLTTRSTSQPLVFAQWCANVVPSRARLTRRGPDVSGPVCPVRAEMDAGQCFLLTHWGGDSWLVTAWDQNLTGAVIFLRCCTACPTSSASRGS